MVSEERAGQLADLATLLLYVGRKLSLYTPDHPDVVHLSTLEGVCLEHIRRHPGITSGDLAAQLGLKTSNASTILRAMEAKGMVRRESSKEDRRQVSVWTTPRAERAIELIYEDWVQKLDSIVGDAAQLRTVISFLETIDEGWQ